jgi:hypothetical protein
MPSWYRSAHLHLSSSSSTRKAVLSKETMMLWVVVCGTVLKQQCAEVNHSKVTRFANSAFVPLTYEGKTAGRVILEVFSGGYGSGMMGAGMMGAGVIGGGMMPGMPMTTGGGGYAAKTTTTTTEVLPGATGVTTMYGGGAYGNAAYGGATYGSTMMTGGPRTSMGGPMPPMGGYASSINPPVGGFVNGMGPRPISPAMMGMGMGVGMGMTRPVSSNFIGGPPVGMISAPPMMNGMPPGMASGIAPPIPPPALASGIRGSFVGNQTNIVNSGIMPPMPPPISPPSILAGLRRSFVAPPLPPAQTSIISSGIVGPAPVLNSGIRDNFVVNPGMGSMIQPPPVTTTVTQITDTTYNPGMTNVTTSGFGGQLGGGAMNAMAGQMAMSNIGGQVGMSNIGANGAMNAAMAGMAGVGAMGMSGIGGIATAGVSTVGVGAMGSSGVAGVAPVTGGLGMSGPTGLGVDMAGRLVDMGRIRLEKVEHYPSFNLFSMLDDHPPMATFRLMPHKLRNY